MLLLFTGAGASDATGLDFFLAEASADVRSKQSIEPAVKTKRAPLRAAMRRRFDAVAEAGSR
ncbi:MAG: hypothetical protein NVSMB1_06970 [Polyangiales bacterium]